MQINFADLNEIRSMSVQTIIAGEQKTLSESEIAEMNEAIRVAKEAMEKYTALCGHAVNRFVEVIGYDFRA